MIITLLIRIAVLSHFSRIRCFVIPQGSHQVLLSMGFFRQESWSGLPCPTPEGLPDPGFEPEAPASPALQVDSLSLSHQRIPN